MSKTVIIAEKPSVAADLARVLGKLPELGKFQKKKDYFENDQAYIASAVGHLVGLKMPTTAEGKKLPWSMNHLPHIPKKFQLEPIERSLPKFKLLVRLLKKKDVDTVVNACDAGREGELIFRYLMQMANLKEDFIIKRMWMQSMTDGAIIDAWNHMRTNEEMENLAQAAICRSESDWLVGLNGTRALTAFNSRNGGFNVTSAGRVQTPTLCILAEREQAIRAFVPRTYFEIHADFRVEKGEYASRWFRQDFKKVEDDPHQKPERIWNREQADEIVARCQGKTGTVEETKKPAKQAPPLLFDLTSLQREAGNKHGFSARRTLQLAQALYDRHKLLTYPRTDSKYLPEDYVDIVKSTIGNLAKAGKSKPHEALPAHLSGCAQWIIDNNRVGPTKRIFNTSKVSDHFAIIPTEKTPSAKLDEAAIKLYQLVLRRFMAIFYPSAEFEVTNRITRVGEDTFRTDGRVLVVPGYLEVYGRKAGVAGDNDEMVAAADGEQADNTAIEVKEKETRPPARYNDSSLLSAMETAGKRVDDDELRDAMSERGLGTPATRASIIENLIRQKYIFRHEINKRDLVVSNKGLALVDLLHDIGISTLGSPEMTGEWEYKLKQMESGELSREVFMNEIKALTKDIVGQTHEYIEERKNRVFPDIHAPCPECGNQEHRQTDGVYECKNPECSFRVKKHIASHEINGDEAVNLITHRQIGPITDFKNRFGQPFEAELALAKEKKTWKLNFVFEGDDRRDEELKSVTDDHVICEAPILDDSDKLIKIYEVESAYLAPEMAVKTDARGVRISKTILQKEIPTEQAVKLFLEGKTDLMPGFISRKKGRPFSAHLTLDREKGKIGFEFAPRKTKKKNDESGGDDGEKIADENKSKPKATKKKATKKKATKKKAAKKKTTTKKPKKES